VDEDKVGRAAFPDEASIWLAEKLAASLVRRASPFEGAGNSV
jgi:hypothetical protein